MLSPIISYIVFLQLLLRRVFQLLLLIYVKSSIIRGLNTLYVTSLQSSIFAKYDLDII